MKVALLVIDMQYFFFRTEERRAKLDELQKNINELIQLFDTKSLAVIHVLTVHRRDKSTWDLGMRRKNQAVLIEETKSTEELPEILQAESHQLLIKTRHSAFIRTDLEKRLRNQGIDTLVLSGVSIHACVGLTAIDAYERDFEVIIAKECIFSHRKLKAGVMLETLKDIFSQKILSNEEIYEILQNQPDGADMPAVAEKISDDALVVRGGRNHPEDIRRGTGTHPSCVTGVSVESAAGVSVVELARAIPHGQVGVTTVGEVRKAGGDVIRTSGRSSYHATLTGLTPEQASKLLTPTIPNPG